MTSIAIWLSQERFVNSLWAVGDSRISQQIGQDCITRHDHGAKIFSIDYACENIRESPERRQAYFHGSIGLAYAGYSNVGLSLYAVLSSLLRSLGGGGETALPTIADISHLAARVMTNYLRALGQEGKCECALFGFCPKAREPQIYHITLDTTVDPFIYKSTPFNLNDDAVLILGASKDFVRKAIIEYRSDPQNAGRRARAPRYVLEQIIESRVDPTIGGNIQLAIASNVKCENYWISTPIEKGKTEAQMVYLGLDIFDKPIKVGDCYIGMHGMI
ncbi:MAG: hypothetical protein WC369_00225 [Dehalococcoidales bacterium]|jgi:hypothetical protein